MRRLAVLLFALVPCLAAAQGLPALHDVTGVGEEDVLNIRAGPSSAAPVIGTLAPDARGIEVVARSEAGTWGQVNTGERAGWASMRFLERQPGQDESALPDPVRCFGTEPFWSLDVARSGLRLDGPGIARVETPLAARSAASGIRGRYGFAGENVADAVAVHGIVRREACTDGMSDRRFGLSLDLLVTSGGVLSQYAGCCSLAR